MKILIVEDEAAAQRYMEMLMKKWGHEVFVASNGKEALEILSFSQVDMVVSDWRMPEMNGVELCHRIRSADHAPYLYFIMLTGKQGHDNLVEGMHSGVDDYLVKPIRAEELKLRMEAAKRVIDQNRTLLGSNEVLDKENSQINEHLSRLSDDLRAAGDLQRSQLPEFVSIQGIEFKSIYYPSEFVAGDVFGVQALDECHVGFYHIDVSGHSVASAMLAFSLNSLLTRPLGEGNPLLKVNPKSKSGFTFVSPVDVISELNSQFQMSLEDALYFTMIYGVINSLTGDVCFTQAGHPHPLLVNNGTVSKLGDGGMPVGMLPGAVYDEYSFRMSDGDHLVLYSDGVEELNSKSPEDGGNDIAAGLSRMPVKDFMEQHIKLCVGQSENSNRDDISMIDVKFSGSMKPENSMADFRTAS